ncbi:unnamed protein product, partial [Ilex paraguariensis]
MMPFTDVDVFYHNRTKVEFGLDNHVRDEVKGLSSLRRISKDELFGQLFDALEKIHYFKSTSDGNDDQVQLDRATNLFHNALEIEEVHEGFHLISQVLSHQVLQNLLQLETRGFPFTFSLSQCDGGDKLMSSGADSGVLIRSFRVGEKLNESKSGGVLSAWHWPC